MALALKMISCEPTDELKKFIYSRATLAIFKEFSDKVEPSIENPNITYEEFVATIDKLIRTHKKNIDTFRTKPFDSQRKKNLAYKPTKNAFFRKSPLTSPKGISKRDLCDHYQCQRKGRGANHSKAECFRKHPELFEQYIAKVQKSRDSQITSRVLPRK